MHAVKIRKDRARYLSSAIIYSKKKIYIKLETKETRKQTRYKNAEIYFISVIQTIKKKKFKDRNINGISLGTKFSFSIK